MQVALNVGLLLGILVSYCPYAELRCTGECPEGWVKFRDHSCLKMFLDASKTKTWHESEAICRVLGPSSHLVTIRDEADNSALSDLVYPVIVWLGLNDIVTEGRWSWVGDQGEDWHRSTHYDAFWVGGNPDNFRSNEDCVSFNWGRVGGWNDFTCHGKIHFVCQMPIVI